MRSLDQHLTSTANFFDGVARFLNPVHGWFGTKKRIVHVHCNFTEIFQPVANRIRECLVQKWVALRENVGIWHLEFW